jgi:deoxycytidylate deaminase
VLSSKVGRILHAMASLLKRGATATNVREALKGTDVDDLIEYSRSIHAEMDAILSVAREGKHSHASIALTIKFRITCWS